MDIQTSVGLDRKYRLKTRKLGYIQIRIDGSDRCSW